MVVSRCIRQTKIYSYLVVPAHYNSVMTLDLLIESYGYVAVATGTFLESNSFALMGGISAHRGYLQLPWVIFWASVGASLGSQAAFFIGRVNGQRLIEGRPDWNTKSIKVQAILDRHEWALIVGYRFVPGMSILAPVLMGASGFSLSRFFLLNIPGGILWAAVMVLIGALFGKAFELVAGDFHRYEIWFFGALTLLAVVWWIDFIRKSRISLAK